MRAATVFLLALVACVAGSSVKVYPEDEVVPDVSFEEELWRESEDSLWEDELEPDTVIIVDQEMDGGLRVTGMMQSFRLDSDSGSINQLLSRPSYLDLSWTNWIDQRLEVLDMFQTLLSPVPRCPHMGPDSSSFDTSMVTYLASSRFGPAILTTYAQQFQDEDEDNFNYEEVYIPEGEPFGKTYEDALLLEDFSADADEAFQRQEGNRLLGQQSLGFFGANVNTNQDQVMYASSLDGSSESLQPNVRSTLPLKMVSYDTYKPTENLGELSGDPVAKDTQQIIGFALFILLCLGCVYVWASLIYSCCRMGTELRCKRKSEVAAAQKLAQDELLAPLMPEGAKHLEDSVQIAASHAVSGTYYAPQGCEYVTVAVPLVNGQPQAY